MARTTRFVLVLMGVLCSASLAGDKPSIIMIYADDMGYGDAGCYGNTNLVPTPNIMMSLSRTIWLQVTRR